MKRIKKYFEGVDNINATMMLNEDTASSNHADMLRTIKLSKNIFKLKMPEANYAVTQNYATLPVPSS